MRKLGGNPSGPLWVTSDAPLSPGTQDTVAPTAPSNLGASAASSSQINLNWSASSDNVGVSSYAILRNGAQIATTAQLSYSDSTVAASTTYNYQVRAYDAAGNQSALSNTASATTPAAPTGSTVVNFDSPAPSGTPDSFISGAFQGINFGSNQWRWSGPYTADPTNSIYFGSNVSSRSFSFSAGPRILERIRVYTGGAAGTLTVTDNLGQTLTQTVAIGGLQTVNFSWPLQSTTITITFTGGWDLGIDDITYR